MNHNSRSSSGFFFLNIYFKLCLSKIILIDPLLYLESYNISLTSSIIFSLLFRPHTSIFTFRFLLLSILSFHRLFVCMYIYPSTSLRYVNSLFYRKEEVIVKFNPCKQWMKHHRHQQQDIFFNRMFGYLVFPFLQHLKSFFGYVIVF